MLLMYDLASQIEKKILVAMPSLNGHPQFSNSVMYVFSYDEIHIRALIINKRMQCSMQELVNKVVAPKRLSVINDAPVLCGGFMRPEEGLILYYDDQENRFDVSFSKDLLMNIAKGLGPQINQVFLGITSWRYDEFEQALKEGHWFVSNQPLKEQLSLKLADRYQAATAYLGVRNLAVFAKEQAEA